MTTQGGIPAGGDLSGWGDAAPAGDARRILESAMDGFCLANTAGRILQVNPALVRLCGWTAEELQGMNLNEVWGSDGPAEISAWLQKIATGGTDRFEALHRHKDRPPFAVEISAAFLPEAGGSVSLFVRDIRERKRLENQARRRWQQELQRSHELLVKLTDQVPGVVYQYQLFLDGRSCFPLASRGMMDIYEVTPEEVRLDATPVFGRLHPDDVAEVSARILRSAETLSLFEAEFRVVLPRQGLRWRQSYATPERLADGSVLWHGIITDVTARMTAELARRESEMRFRALFEGAADAVFLHDVTGRIVDVNRTACTMLGYTREELVGRNVAEIDVAPQSRPMPEVWSGIAAETPVTVKGVHRRKNGTTYPVEVHIAPFASREGPLLFAAARDVSQRQAAERMLRLQGGALEAAANAVVITAMDGRVEWANAAFTQLSGWPLAECVGRDLRSLIRSDAQEPAFFDEMWRTIGAGKVWRGELVNRRRDGSLWTEDMTITPLPDEHGAISHYVAIKQDITEKKQMERRLLQSQRMEAMGRLAGGIAHDLNNILAPMLMVIPLVRERVPDAPTQDLLEMVLHEARRGGDIIKQLLAFTRGLEGPRTPVLPAATLAEVEKVLRETFPRNITVHTRWVPNLWRVLADPTQMHQVLLNLSINARDAMPEGGQLILAATNATLAAGDRRLPAGASPGPYVLLEVTDTGTGISASIKEMIFEPFFTTKPIGQGSGLGLSTVLGIVRSHLGFVQVDSEVGCGSTFRVFLPAMVETGPPAAPAKSSADRAKGHGEMILVVDDEPMLRLSVTVALQRSGYQVCTAESGETALTVFLARRAEIRLILTDIMMPGMGGTALIGQLREIAPRLPVIATSGLTDRDRSAELGALGVTDILPKPCTLERLLETVQRQLVATDPAKG